VGRPLHRRRAARAGADAHGDRRHPRRAHPAAEAAARAQAEALEAEALEAAALEAAAREAAEAPPFYGPPLPEEVDPPPSADALTPAPPRPPPPGAADPVGAAGDARADARIDDRDDGDDAPPEADVAAIVVSLATASWADLYIDGERRGQVRMPMEIAVTPGAHTLTLRNAYAFDYNEPFEIAAGERLVFDGITLRKKPITVRFADSVDPECQILRNDNLIGQAVGTLTAGSLTLQDPDGWRALTLLCPGGTRQSFPMDKVLPGSIITLPADR